MSVAIEAATRRWSAYWLHEPTPEDAECVTLAILLAAAEAAEMRVTKAPIKSLDDAIGLLDYARRVMATEAQFFVDSGSAQRHFERAAAFICPTRPCNLSFAN